MAGPPSPRGQESEPEARSLCLSPEGAGKASSPTRSHALWETEAQRGYVQGHRSGAGAGLEHKAVPLCHEAASVFLSLDPRCPDWETEAQRWGGAWSGQKGKSDMVHAVCY